MEHAYYTRDYRVNRRWATRLMALTDVYVREPWLATGNNDGTSYADAYRGVGELDGLNISGKQIWICGLQQHRPTSAAARASTIDLGSGTSAAQKTIIRFDYPGDPGVVWGGYRLDFGTWVQQGSPNTNVWVNSFVSGSAPNAAYKEIDVDSTPESAALTKVADIATCQATADSFYTSGTDIGVNIGGDPTDKIHLSASGTTLDIVGSSDLIFHNGKFYVCKFGTDQQTPAPQRCEFRRMTLQGTGYEIRLLGFHGLCESPVFDRCTIKDAANLIYWTNNGFSGPDTSARNGRVTRCTLTDAGVLDNGGIGDCHAIGTMDGGDHLLSDNVIERAGRAIVSHFDASTAPDGPVTIERNVIRDCEDFLSEGFTPAGIGLESDGLNTNAKYGAIRYNYVFDSNGVMDGIQSLWHRLGPTTDPGIVVEYNHFEGCNESIRFAGIPTIKAHNNTSKDPVTYHVNWRSQPASGWYFDFDYNTYIGGGGPAADLWRHYAIAGTFAEWQGHGSATPDKFDPSGSAS